MEPTYKIAQRLHERRAAKGVKQYGRHLDADSQGCMLVHALEEAADQVNYLIAEIQRRRKLMKWLSVTLTQGGKAHALFEELGGEAALAKYDEILGGGTVANSATVEPDPRDEALRVATEALQFVADHATNAGGVRMDAEPQYRFLTTGQNELIHTVFSALAAIRGAR